MSKDLYNAGCAKGLGTPVSTGFFPAAFHWGMILHDSSSQLNTLVL